MTQPGAFLSLFRTVCVLVVRVTTDAVNGDTGTTGVTDAVREHLRWMQVAHRAPSYIASRRLVLRLLAQHAGRPPELLTGQELYAWQCSLGPLLRTTQATYLSHAVCFYRWLADGHGREDDPSKMLVRFYVPRGEADPIREPALARLLADSRLPSVVRLWLMLAAFCGLRAAEIAGLRREDLLDDEEPAFLRVTGKRSKVRLVAVPPSVLAELRGFGLPERGRLFWWSAGRPETGRHVSATCNRWLHRLGERRSLHKGRHRFASRLLDAGANLRMVQEALGHERPETTAIYTQVLPRDAAPFVASIDHPLI